MTTGAGLNRWTAIIFGAILVLVGIWGFFQDPVFGLFEVSLTHNFVHLITGAVLLAAAFVNDGTPSRMTLLVLGVVYALVTILGFVAFDLTNQLLGPIENELALNTADNLLHLLLTVVFIGVPLVARGEERHTVRGTPRT